MWTRCNGGVDRSLTTLLWRELSTRSGKRDFRIIRAGSRAAPPAKAGRTINPGSRAFDVLTTLVESAGQTVRNAQIMTRALPATTVDEGSVRVHIGALRKSSGDGRGQHYRSWLPLHRAGRASAKWLRGRRSSAAALIARCGWRGCARRDVEAVALTSEISLAPCMRDRI